MPSAVVVPKNILLAALPINLFADEPSTPIIEVTVVFLISNDFSVFAESSAITRLPDIVPPARGSFVAIELVRVVLRAASLFRAVAISPNVSRVDGAEFTIFATAVLTKAVVAILVVLLPALCVVVVGLPPKATSSAMCADAI